MKIILMMAMMANLFSCSQKGLLQKNEESSISVDSQNIILSDNSDVNNSEMISIGPVKSGADLIKRVYVQNNSTKTLVIDAQGIQSQLAGQTRLSIVPETNTCLGKVKTQKSCFFDLKLAYISSEDYSSNISLDVMDLTQNKTFGQFIIVTSKEANQVVNHNIVMHQVGQILNIHSNAEKLRLYVSNAGSVTEAIGSLNIPDPFVIESSSCGTQLKLNNSCFVDLKVDPSKTSGYSTVVKSISIGGKSFNLKSSLSSNAVSCDSGFYLNASGICKKTGMWITGWKGVDVGAFKGSIPASKLAQTNLVLKNSNDNVINPVDGDLNATLGYKNYGATNADFYIGSQADSLIPNELVTKQSDFYGVDTDYGFSAQLDPLQSYTISSDIGSSGLIKRGIAINISMEATSAFVAPNGVTIYKSASIIVDNASGNSYTFHVNPSALQGKSFVAVNAFAFYRPKIMAQTCGTNGGQTISQDGGVTWSACSQVLACGIHSENAPTPDSTSFEYIAQTNFGRPGAYRKRFICITEGIPVPGMGGSASDSIPAPSNLNTVNTVLSQSWKTGETARVNAVTGGACYSQVQNPGQANAFKQLVQQRYICPESPDLFLRLPNRIASSRNNADLVTQSNSQYCMDYGNNGWLHRSNYLPNNINFSSSYDLINNQSGGVFPNQSLSTAQSSLESIGCTLITDDDDIFYSILPK